MSDELVKKFLEVSNVALPATHSGAEVNQAIEFYRRKIWPSEVRETMLAYENNDQVEMYDGVGDQSFIVIAVGLMGGDNDDMNNILSGSVEMSGIKQVEVLEHIITTVCESNLTKFDTTDDEVVKTSQKYLDLGIETYRIWNEKHKLFATFSSFDQTDHNGKEWPANKLVKSAVNYREPDFRAILHV